MTTLATPSPFHEGELDVQRRLGVKDKIARFGERALVPFMPDEHREFLEQLPFVFVGALDVSGQPWASMVWGLPGFAEAPDAETVELASVIAPGDPLRTNLVLGAPVGILAIELETRSRIRVNGTVLAREGDAFAVHVKQSFGNCQKYIQIREAKLRRDPSLPIESTPSPEGALLSPEATRIVTAADTFFIASTSRHPSEPVINEGVDVSHRGGLPGFARLGEDGGRSTITFPDYLGNFLFNTLGNIQVNPLVGLLFVDFERGTLLSLAGEATIVWDGPEVTAVDGAQRLVRVNVTSGVMMPEVLPFSWSAPSFAPQFRRMQHTPA
ncbi:MAG TPA: pyridoxamine 5'-phosphate oxidase family protein [Polyangiaceae bacterium]|nr:pyridoxamine 5'-phosphate oxidase family protein [Polyangiaceae bacterium]